MGIYIYDLRSLFHSAAYNIDGERGEGRDSCHFGRELIHHDDDDPPAAFRLDEKYFQPLF